MHGTNVKKKMCIVSMLM